MAAGFQIFGDNGNLQVDENYFNMSLIQKGTIYLPAGTVAQGGATLSRSSLTFWGTYPMLFLRPRNTVAAVTSVTVNGTEHKFTIVGGLTEGGTAQEDWVEWYLFDKPPQPGPHGAGLQVFDANGQCTFDSDYPPMRVAGFVSVPTNTNDSYLDLPWGHYAVCIGQGRHLRGSNPITTGQTLVDTFIVRDNQVRLTLSRFLLGGPSNGSSYALGGGGLAMVIDSSRL